MGTVRAGSARGGKSVVAGEVSVLGLCGNLHRCRRRAGMTPSSSSTGSPMGRTPVLCLGVMPSLSLGLVVNYLVWYSEELYLQYVCHRTCILCPVWCRIVRCALALFCMVRFSLDFFMYVRL